MGRLVHVGPDLVAGRSSLAERGSQRGAQPPGAHRTSAVPVHVHTGGASVRHRKLAPKLLSHAVPPTWVTDAATSSSVANAGNSVPVRHTSVAAPPRANAARSDSAVCQWSNEYVIATALSN